MRNRVLFLAIAWLIVLMPFLFWRGTWFGRPLSEQQMADYLHDVTKPRHTQHALVQIGERMSRKDASVQIWYPDLVVLASSPVEEIRNTDAWVMGQDPTRPEFHEALLKMLHDPSPPVRGNAALALVRFGDTSGHDQLLALLQASVLRAPRAGKVVDTAAPGTLIHQNGVVAKLKSGSDTIEIRTPSAGRVRWVVKQQGAEVDAGAEIATIAPGADQVWEALRALYVIGRPDDLPFIAPYLRESGDMPDRVRQQAQLTDTAIRKRAP